MGFYKDLLKNNIPLWITILTPIIAMPLPILVNTKVSRSYFQVILAWAFELKSDMNAHKAGYCGYSLIIIVVYWITECLPLAITSLLPVVLFPLFAILDSKTTSKIYFEDINMLFFGGWRLNFSGPSSLLLFHEAQLEFVFQVWWWL